MSNSLRQIGKIFKAHGLRGDVKIYSILDLMQFIKPDDFIYINNDENYIPFKIKELKHFKKNIYLVSFKEIDHIQKIENLINCEIFSKNEKIFNAEEKNYHGFEVEDIKFGNIGKVSNKIQASNYSVLIVRKENREVFIPMHDNFILEINGEKIKVKINEDLLNLNN
tara:strand:- start:101553 stop:102053 length:501 start_codon:yes stop_codon:yes gene_type:complete